MLALLAAMLATIGTAPAAASDVRLHAEAGVTRSPATNPAAIWIVRGALRLVGRWAVAHATDRVMDRIGVTAVVDDALNNLLGIENDPSISPELRRELRSMGAQLRSYREILARNGQSDQVTQRQLRNLHRDFDAHVRATEQRLVAIESQIRRVETEQRKQLLMIVDLDRRVALIEGRLANAEGRIMQLDGRVGALETAVFPDPDRFLRHEAYLSGALLYANSPALGGDAMIGGEVAAQYNFNQHIGAFAGLALMRLRAADVGGMDEGSSLLWNNMNLHVGASVNLLPPRSAAGFQLAAGGGIASSLLVYHPPGVERTADNGQEVGSASNVYLIVRGDLGVAPPAYDWEPIISFGYMSFLEDVAYSGENISSNLGRSVWYLTLGVRFRQYLRGTPRRVTSGAINANR